MKKTLLVMIILLTLSGCGVARNSPQQTVASPAATDNTMPLSTSSETTLPVPPSKEPLPSVKPPLTKADIDQAAEHISVYDRTIIEVDFFADCRNVKELFLSDCTIADGVILPYVENLESIYLTNCSPKDAEIIKNNTQITKLGLGANMTDLNILKDLPTLVVLSLTANDIKDLSPVSMCENLEYLYLNDGNYELTTLKPLFGLKKLSVISMNLKTYFNIEREDLEHYGADPDFETYPDPECIIEVD